MPFDRRVVLLLLIAGTAALILVGRVLPRPSAPAAEFAPAVSVGSDASSASGDGVRGPVVVDVVGAVRHPGVYRLPGGSRTRDAVRRAGGATRRADVGALNLATRLADGEQVRVPLRASAVTTVPGTGASPPPAIVHLNSATPAELDALDGIGPSLAQRIVDYRAAHGGFGSIDELDEVSGIGPVRLESLRTLLAL